MYARKLHLCIFSPYEVKYISVLLQDFTKAHMHPLITQSYCSRNARISRQRLGAITKPEYECFDFLQTQSMSRYWKLPSFLKFYTNPVQILTTRTHLLLGSSVILLFLMYFIDYLPQFISTPLTTNLKFLKCKSCS